MIRKIFNKIRRSLNNTSDLRDIIRKDISQKMIIEMEREIRTLHLQDRNFVSTERGITDEKYFINNVIVSLTSYGKRIHDVYLPIESLMHQTVKPNKIILWLAEDEFSLDNIPVTLKNLQKRGLMIEFCEDIKSYKKLVPALKKYPDDIIITVDDDVIYQYDLVENLLNSYKQNPDMIHFCRGHKMLFTENGNLKGYNEWAHYMDDFNADKLNFSTGVGGVLYPPNSLYSEVTNENVFMALAPYTDDVWFKAMALIQGTLSKKVFTRSSTGVDYIYLNGEIQNETALWKNVNKKKNDEQIKAVFSEYGIYGLLKQKNIK